jgi:hypothetical protein
MHPTPHALFTRDRHGVTLTIEINPLTFPSTGYYSVNGVRTETKRADVLTISKGIDPFWSYQSGFGGPIWNERNRSGYATTPGDKSYITLLRIAVAQLTSGGFGFIYGMHKPKLGFHSKYKTRKRAEKEAARLAKVG